MLCVFVIAAGAAVAGLLPARLARWDVPRVGARSPAAPQPPLAAAGGTGGGSVRSAGSAVGLGATPAGLKAALSPLLGSPLLGSHVGMLVTSLSTGQVLYSRHAASAFAPASTTKLATAVAALHRPGRRR
jgi:serine-type D-Ala-D-Ala carboxypeptidase/endopeptidase (penicillin-binding protein 4)